MQSQNFRKLMLGLAGGAGLCLLGGAVAGCERDAGDHMEDAADDMRDAADDAGDAMEDTLDDAGDAIDDAADDLTDG